MTRLSEFVLTASVYVEAETGTDALQVIEDANRRMPTGVYIRVPDEPNIEEVRTPDELEEKWRNSAEEQFDENMNRP